MRCWDKQNTMREAEYNRDVLTGKKKLLSILIKKKLIISCMMNFNFTAVLQ